MRSRPRNRPNAAVTDDTVNTRRRRRRQAAMAARIERDRMMAERAPQTAAELIGLYRTEKARAMERWARNGGPVCGLTSGRHPQTAPAARQSV